MLPCCHAMPCQVWAVGGQEVIEKAMAAHDKTREVKQENMAKAGKVRGLGAECCTHRACAPWRGLCCDDILVLGGVSN
jgi:hypothetical protein